MSLIPQNEQEVVYLFSRIHEKLGFEKILKFTSASTPDCIALKNGKEVGIELEFKLKSFFKHYEVTRFPSKDVYGHKILDDSLLIFKKNDPTEIISKFPAKDFDVWDPSIHNIKLQYLKTDPLIVIHKSLSKKIQYVVCWEKDCVLEDDIAIIELKNMKNSV